MFTCPPTAPEIAFPDSELQKVRHLCRKEASAPVPVAVKANCPARKAPKIWHCQLTAWIREHGVFRRLSLVGAGIAQHGSPIRPRG